MKDLRLAIGLGSRSGVDTITVIHAVTQALANISGVPVGLYTLDRRSDEPGLVAAAAELRLPLAGLAPEALAERSGEVMTWSSRSQAAAGVPSVAETAALVGAGPGSRLVVARRTEGGITVAVAAALEEP